MCVKILFLHSSSSLSFQITLTSFPHFHHYAIIITVPPPFTKNGNRFASASRQTFTILMIVMCESVCTTSFAIEKFFGNWNLRQCRKRQSQIQQNFTYLHVRTYNIGYIIGNVKISGIALECIFSFFLGLLEKKKELKLCQDAFAM